MKHIFPFILLLFLLSTVPSCNSSLITMEEKPDSSITLTDDFRVTLDMARSFAASIKERGPIESEECFSFRGDTLLYLFNYKDGWIVVSSDSRTDPIMAFNENGHLTFDQISSSIAGIWYEYMARDLLALRKSDIPATRSSDDNPWDGFKHLPMRDSLPDYPYWIRQSSSAVSTSYLENYGPLTQTKWGQGYPWNSEMFYGYDSNGNIQQCILGCTSVAVSQLLYYTHYFLGKPTGLYHDVSVSGFKYDLDTGPQDISHENYTSNSSRWDDMATHWYDYHTDYVGDFIMDVGFRLNTKYWVEKSHASLSTSSFNYYAITCDKISYNADTVRYYLSQGNPIIITAFETYTPLDIFHPYKTGHAWIIDGWKRRQYSVSLTYHWFLISSEDDLLALTLDGTEDYYDYDIGYMENHGQEYTYYNYSYSTPFILMNWGFDGVDDTTEYNPYAGSIWHGGGYNFQYNKEIYYHFR